MGGNFALLFLPLLLWFALVLPVVIGVFVYRDARARGMDAVLWTIVAILAPSLIGLIIYLVVRGSHCTLVCPQCRRSVEEGFVTCPHCGAELKFRCPHCGTPTEPDWLCCAQCGAQLPAARPAATPQPSRRSGGVGLWIGLACAILIPSALIVLTLLAFLLLNG